MKILCNAASIRGNKSFNQDRFCIDDRVLSFDSPNIQCELDLSAKGMMHVIAVADGVTNSLDGGAAASAVVKSIYNAYRNGEFNDNQFDYPNVFFDEIMGRAAAEIRWQFREYEGSGSASTTISIIAFDANKVYAYNLGDSPIYIMREGKWIPLFNEDTVGAEKVKDNENKGFFKKIFKKVDEPSKCDFNCLTKCVSGLSYEIEGNCAIADFLDNDIILVASDGLFKAINKEEAIGVQNVEQLIKMARENYADDDVTVVLVWKDFGMDKEECDESSKNDC